MQLIFLIDDEIKYVAKVNQTRDQLKLYLPNSRYNQNNFKIPRTKNEYDSSMSYYSSDSFNASSDDEDDEDKNDEKEESIELGKKHLRRSKTNTDLENFFIEGNNNKKQKKELTEEEINKKHEQMMKRKTHTQRLLEEEKRQTIEKILNEDGRKLRERQKKINEEVLKKELKKDENYQISLTKIKHFIGKDKTYVRFPQGLLIPKILSQKPLIRNTSIQNCEVLSCKNIKKYKDPVTKKFYCSVECYKELKKSMHIN